MKKYCCLIRSSLPSFVLSAGYNNFEIDDAIASASEDFEYSPRSNNFILKPVFAFASQRRSVFTVSVLYPEINRSYGSAWIEV